MEYIKDPKMIETRSFEIIQGIIDDIRPGYKFKNEIEEKIMQEKREKNANKKGNFFKKHKFKSWKSKPIKIKEIALKSYPSVDMNDELVSNLSQIARLINEYQKAIDIIKYKITFLAKKSKYFEPINSIYGIGEFTTSIIIAELGDINRFNNIKELTAYCGLDPSIKQSGKSINVHGPISKSGNKYMRKILYISVSNIIRLTAISKQENDIELYYRKKRNEGKHHYASIVACTTKLLRKILALCKQLDNQ